MTTLTKISCILISISFAFRLVQVIPYGFCLVMGILIMLYEKKVFIAKWATDSLKSFDKYVLTFLIFSLISNSFFSIAPLRSFSVSLYLLIFIYLGYFIFNNFKNEESELKLLCNFLIISSFFSILLIFTYILASQESIEILLRKIKNFKIDEINKYKGVLNSLCLMICLMPLIEKFLGHKNYFISYLMFLLLIPSLILSNCNSAFLGILSGFFLIFLQNIYPFFKKKVLLLSIFFGSIIFLLSTNLFINNFNNSLCREKCSTDLRTLYNYEGYKFYDFNFLIPTSLIDPHRQFIWAFSLNKFKEKMWIGYGSDTSNLIDGSQEKIGHKHTGTMHFIPSHPHNFFIELLLDGGLITTLSFLLFICYFNLKFYNIIKIFEIRYLTFLNGFFWGSSLVNFSFWNAWWQSIYFILVAIICSIIYRINNQIKN